MPEAADSVTLELRGPDGRAVGRMTLALLPKEDSALPPILVGNDPEHPELEPVQLLEGEEYRYELDASPVPDAWLEPSEMFSPDRRGALTGRMRVRLATGRLPIRLTTHGKWLGQAAVEVRSLKLNYLSDYRRMLDDLVEFGADLLLQRFAPSEQRMRIDPQSNSESLYQRFCFLRSLVSSDRMEGAIARVLRQPYVEWRGDIVSVPPGRGLRAGREAARALTRPGPRIRPESNAASVVELYPLRIETRSFEETVDNVPNRFLRFVFEEWRNEVATLGDIIAQRARLEADSAVLRRASIEITETLTTIEDTLRAPLFRDVGVLRGAPGANQVLQRRSGYREIVEAYVLSQFAAAISWSGGDDIFGAGQRNVATLYEYWVFLKLVRVAGTYARDPVDFSALFRPSKGGSELRLRHGTESGVSMTVVRTGVPMRLDVTFNRTYAAGVGGDSWTRTMKPDCSMEITPLANRFDEPVRIHFDAKYRVDDVSDLFGELHDVSARRDDLLKMHAYRDAIVRAAGAYVVYPGTREEVAAKHHEVLPGLGAFALRPANAGSTDGEKELARFLGGVLDHVASQATRRGRAEYWQMETNRSSGLLAAVDGNVDWLMKPPADTLVLLGFVKNVDHASWVRARRLYNLRGDERSGAVTSTARELAADVLLLYGEGMGQDVELFEITGAPRVLAGDALRTLGYPHPRGALYFCLQLGSPLRKPPWLTREVVDTMLARMSEHVYGAPVSGTVQELMHCATKS